MAAALDTLLQRQEASGKHLPSAPGEPNRHTPCKVVVSKLHTSPLAMHCTPQSVQVFRTCMDFLLRMFLSERVAATTLGLFAVGLKCNVEKSRPAFGRRASLASHELESQGQKSVMNGEGAC